MSFTKKIKELREDKQYSQRHIASLLGIDVALYNRFEKGERCMRREMVEKLASIYDLPSDELIKYWLAGQIYAILLEEKMASEAMMIVAESLPSYGRNGENTQLLNH